MFMLPKSFSFRLCLIIHREMLLEMERFLPLETSFSQGSSVMKLPGKTCSRCHSNNVFMYCRNRKKLLRTRLMMCHEVQFALCTEFLINYAVTVFWLYWAIRHIFMLNEYNRWAILKNNFLHGGLRGMLTNISFPPAHRHLYCCCVVLLFTFLLHSCANIIAFFCFVISIVYKKVHRCVCFSFQFLACCFLRKLYFFFSDVKLIAL